MSERTMTLPRSAVDQDWPRVVRWGLICGLALVSLCLVGMPVELDKRAIIERHLSLGYLFVLLVPIAMGWVSSTLLALEGVENRRQGLYDLVTGLMVGPGVALYTYIIERG